MSQLRIIKLRYDLKKITDIAEEMKCDLLENTYLTGYSTKSYKCAYVVRKGFQELGFTEDGEAVFDDMHSEFVSEFTSRYVEKLLQERNIPYEKVSSKNQIALIIRR